MRPTHTALLRAVNLAGHNRVGMRELRDLASRLGLGDARTLLQSGNLLFSSRNTTGAELEAALERGARERLGLDTRFFVRDAREWSALLAGNPFPEQAARNPGHLLVVFLEEARGPRDAEALQETIAGREVVAAGGRHLYTAYPDGVGRSKLTLARIEKGLATRATARNWNTVLKIAQLLEAAP